MVLIYSSKLFIFCIVCKFLNEWGAIDRKGFLEPYLEINIDQAYDLLVARSEVSLLVGSSVSLEMRDRLTD